MYREKLLQKIDKLDKEVEGLISNLKAYSTKQLQSKPAPDVWSPIQILNHIILSEQRSLEYCKKKLSFDPKLKKASWRSWMNSRLVMLALISPFKFKAPGAVAEDQFSNSDTLDSIETKWKATREDWRTYISDLSEKYLDKEVYKHPFGMRMSLGGMLDFFLTHFHRHRKQLLKRI